MISVPTFLKRDRVRNGSLRIAIAIGAASAFALGVYLLINATRPQSGLVGFSFLLVLPAAVTSFVVYAGDPLNERPRSFYWRMPWYLLGVVIIGSFIVLREGVICVLILSPLWLASSYIGTWATLAARRRQHNEDSRSYSLAVLALPLVAMQVEPSVPVPQSFQTVTRSIIVDARPATIWPLLEGIPDVAPGEGAWNVSQDIIGLPRPVGARLIGQGVGAERLARWEDKVSFRERITEWRPGHAIGWRFIFDDLAGWAFTDQHLVPDSQYFRITTGGYRAERIADGRTRVTLTTRYWIKTPVNGYSALWGELVLGDVENNLLALIKQRAERRLRTT